MAEQSSTQKYSLQYLKMDNAIRIPDVDQLKLFYKNYHDSLLNNVIVKIKESNKVKSNTADPHSRTVCIPDVHRLLFAGVFSSKFLIKEKSTVGVDLKRSSPIFDLQTLDRVKGSFSCWFISIVFNW